MRTLTLVLVALAVAGSAAAQRRARIGPTVSTISIEDGSGSSHSFTSFGGSFAFLSGDDGEIGVAVSRYGDLSNNSCVRQMTFFGVESNYYPVGPKGIAPFASTSLGLAHVLDEDAALSPLGICSTSATPTVNARVLWLQRNDASNRNAFLLQAGISVSPPIESR